jgi:hypothetical protein
MTLPVLRRIAALAEAGATIVGNAPQSSPSLNDDAAEFQALVRRLWLGPTTTEIGTGRVIAGSDVEAALASMGLVPDFSYPPPQTDSELLFVHRRIADGDAYFLSNRRNRLVRVEARFRIGGRQPEIWRADTGTTELVSYRIEGDQTIVPLEFGAEESFFVMFRKATTAPSATVPVRSYAPVTELSGAWDVSFQPGRGAPATTKFEVLKSLTEHTDPGVRYFSGTSTYTRVFQLPLGVQPGEPLLLRLGQVGDVAEVLVNGQTVGIVWKPPYALDIGVAVKPGPNKLEVRVANLWVNRLIGDAQPNATKVAFTTMPMYRSDAPLRPAGLIGPVMLLRSSPVN